MNSNNIDLNNNKPNYADEDFIDLKGIIIKIVSYWHFFVIGVVIALCIGFIYNRYASKVYQVSASLYIKEDKMTIDPTSMMTGLTFKSNNNISNEIGILQSFTMKERNVFCFKTKVCLYLSVPIVFITYETFF